MAVEAVTGPFVAVTTPGAGVGAAAGSFRFGWPDMVALASWSGVEFGCLHAVARG